jgi:hypothetical protein
MVDDESIHAASKTQERGTMIGQPYLASVVACDIMALRASSPPSTLGRGLEGYNCEKNK